MHFEGTHYDVYLSENSLKLEPHTIRGFFKDGYNIPKGSIYDAQFRWKQTVDKADIIFGDTLRTAYIDLTLKSGKVITIEFTNGDNGQVCFSYIKGTYLMNR